MTELKIIFHPIEQKIRIKEKISQNTWADIKQNPTQNFIQDLPGDFFRNLFKNYDEKNIQITFKGTVMDYEDLKQMVAFYNGQNEDTKLSLLENFEELPSVENCYREIKVTSKKILNSLQQDITYESDGKIKEELEFLSKTIDIAANAEEEPIHLCFIGAYSTGKSTVINALLGSKILPDAEESKTAKIFKINNSNNISLELKISGSATEEFICIEENRQTKSLELVKDSSDKSFNEKLKYHISNCQKNGTSLDGQLLEMLDYLNDKENVLEITINYPIEFLNDTKCVIYDTPGADSDESQNHEAVLDSILKQQKNCILFVILSPTKTEGTGNRRVFELLSDAETTKSNSNGINLSMERCFYVYNMADTMKSDSYKEGLANKELKLLTVAKDDDGNIKETESKIIKMANHRVFLTSAAWGLAASKKFHYDEDDKDNYIYESKKKSFYKKNLSIREQEIKKVIDYCDKEKEATDDVDKKLLIDSGIFALQKSIQDYVNKYSTAIHAHRFFTEIKLPIKEFSSKVNNLAERISKDVTDLEEEQKNLTTNIKAALDKLLKDENDKVDKLELDKNFSQEDKSEEIKRYINNKVDSAKLTWIFGKQKVDQALHRIENDVSEFINSKVKEMNVEYDKMRSQKKETFKNLVIELLKNNGVSQCKIAALTSTKAEVKDISHSIDTFIWSWVSNKNKNSYKDDLNRKARAQFFDCSNQYKAENIKKTIREDYRKYIDSLKDNIKKESSEIKAVIEQREIKEQELAKLKPVSEKLDNYIESLMKVMNLEEDGK